MAREYWFDFVDNFTSDPLLSAISLASQETSHKSAIDCGLEEFRCYKLKDAGIMAVLMLQFKITEDQHVHMKYANVELNFHQDNTSVNGPSIGAFHPDNLKGESKGKDVTMTFALEPKVQEVSPGKFERTSVKRKETNWTFSTTKLSKEAQSRYNLLRLDWDAQDKYSHQSFNKRSIWVIAVLERAFGAATLKITGGANGELSKKSWVRGTPTSHTGSADPKTLEVKLPKEPAGVLDITKKEFDKALRKWVSDQNQHNIPRVASDLAAEGSNE